MPDSGSRIRPPRSLARPPGPARPVRATPATTASSAHSLAQCVPQKRFHRSPIPSPVATLELRIASASQRFVFLLFSFPPKKVRILFWFWRNLISCLGPSPPRLFELLQRQSPFALSPSFLHPAQGVVVVVAYRR